MKVKITWIETATGNAACLGLDELIPCGSSTDVSDFPAETGEMMEQYRQDALHYGACHGVDLDRYEPALEIVEDD